MTTFAVPVNTRLLAKCEAAGPKIVITSPSLKRNAMRDSRVLLPIVRCQEVYFCIDACLRERVGAATMLKYLG